MKGQVNACTDGRNVLNKVNALNGMYARTNQTMNEMSVADEMTGMNDRSDGIGWMTKVRTHE